MWSADCLIYLDRSGCRRNCGARFGTLASRVVFHLPLIVACELDVGFAKTADD